jgi:hypothetical protein
MSYETRHFVIKTKEAGGPDDLNFQVPSNKLDILFLVEGCLEIELGLHSSNKLLKRFLCDDTLKEPFRTELKISNSEVCAFVVIVSDLNYTLRAKEYTRMWHLRVTRNTLLKDVNKKVNYQSDAILICQVDSLLLKRIKQIFYIWIPFKTLPNQASSGFQIRVYRNDFLSNTDFQNLVSPNHFHVFCVFSGAVVIKFTSKQEEKSFVLSSKENPFFWIPAGTMFLIQQRSTEISKRDEEKESGVVHLIITV